LVRDLRDEVGLELGQIALAPQEHPDEDDTRRERSAEREDQDPHEQVEARLAGHEEEDADRREEDARHDDEPDEEHDDPAIAERCEVAPAPRDGGPARQAVILSRTSGGWGAGSSETTKASRTRGSASSACSRERTWRRASGWLASTCAPRVTRSSM